MKFIEVTRVVDNTKRLIGINYILDLFERELDGCTVIYFSIPYHNNLKNIVVREKYKDIRKKLDGIIIT